MEWMIGKEEKQVLSRRERKNNSQNLKPLDVGITSKKLLIGSLFIINVYFVKELLLKMATPQHNIWKPCST